MKSKSILLSAIAIMAVAAVIIPNVGDILAARSAVSSPPTEAPTATPGPAPTDMPMVLPTLVGGPLVTADQALAYALTIDHGMSIWVQPSTPWTLDTPKTDPTRIALALFPSETAADGGGPDEFAPGHDEAVGPVWRVSIKGRVHVSMITMWSGPDNYVYDGVTYTIAQRSGALLGIDTGAMIPGVVITLPPPPTSLPSATPTLLGYPAPPTAAGYPAPATAVPTGDGYPFH